MKKVIQWIYVLFMGIATPTAILMLILGGYQFTPGTAAICIILGTMGTVAAYMILMAMLSKPDDKQMYLGDDKSWSEIRSYPVTGRQYLLIDGGVIQLPPLPSEKT